MAVLEVRGLAKRYGGFYAVRSVDMDVGRGCHGLIGPNGAGKTTTLKSIVGLVVPTRGQIRLLGEDLLGPGGWRLRRLIGYVAEVPSLPRGYTVERFLVESGLLYGLSEADARREAARALEEVGLGEKRGSKVESLSKGQRKRLIFAEALLLPRELYVLDEPFTGLDPASVAWARGLVRRLSRGAAVLVSSHLLREVEDLVDHVTLITRGVAVFSGSVGELQAKLGEGSRLLVEVSEPRRAVEVLSRSGYEAELLGGGRLAVRIRERREAARVIRALVEAGLDVYEARVVSMSLEEAYMRLLGGSGVGGS